MRTLYPVSILFVVMTTIASFSPSRAQPGLEGAAHGIIDSVRDVLLGTLLGGYADALEHAVGPGQQIVVRLDDGQAFTILQNTFEHFEPGERVLLYPSKFGTRLEHAPR